MTNNRPLGIIVTVLTALICCCAAIFSSVWGVIIASGAPINVTDSSGISTPQTVPAPIGYVLLCLSVIFVLVPVAVGFLTLRKKPQAAVPVNNDPLPPAS